MTMPNEPSNESARSTQRDWLLLIARSLAVSVEVFLRNGFGERYLGTQAALAIVIIPLFQLPFLNADPRPLLAFLVVYMVLCAAARIGVWVRRWRGIAGHTYYTGRPVLRRLLPFVSEITIKHRIEPIVTLLVGGLMLALSKPLGFYLMVAGIALAASGVLIDAGERERLSDMTDAFIEQRRLAERFRERMHD